ncbi:MAG TPA: hypothetical protein [Caudoviricetes sp.]|nr:MAG TPA: hypothetical protein [Caudoviricetes sp.]
MKSILLLERIIESGLVLGGLNYKTDLIQEFPTLIGMALLKSMISY